jgi:hypothetical protein
MRPFSRISVIRTLAEVTQRFATAVALGDVPSTSNCTSKQPASGLAKRNELGPAGEFASSGCIAQNGRMASKGEELRVKSKVPSADAVNEVSLTKARRVESVVLALSRYDRPLCRPVITMRTV